MFFLCLFDYEEPIYHHQIFIVRLCWANTLKLYKAPLFCHVYRNHFCISLFSFEQGLIAFYLISRILILDKLRIFRMKTSLFKKQQRLLENYKIIVYYSPLWGCAGERVEMVVKCIGELFWGTHFQHGDKFVPQTVPKSTLTTISTRSTAPQSQNGEYQMLTH